MTSTKGAYFGAKTCSLNRANPCCTFQSHFDRRKHHFTDVFYLTRCVYRMFPEILKTNICDSVNVTGMQSYRKTSLKPKCKNECIEDDSKKSQRDSNGSRQAGIIRDEVDGVSAPGTSGLPTKTAVNGNETESKCASSNVKEAPAKAVPVLVPHQIATRSVTGRLNKRLRSYSPPHSPPPPKRQAKEPPKPPVTNTNTSGTPETKTRKQWEQWSIQDKNLFFEALYEHGKDFEAIQSWISQKLKKKDPNCGVRTRDHIRHFYYRTWHKIVKHIDLEGYDDLNKQAVELYGLINYGELRKRIGKLDDKMGQKLNELVHKGVTVVKVKSKNNRIKTPVCRALKKLHHIEDHKDEEKTKMPDKVTIELFPSTNVAWSRVQSMAQNPRIKVTLRVNKRVSSLLEFLNKKWKEDRLKQKEKLDETEVLPSEIKFHVPEGHKMNPLVVKQAPPPPKLEFSFDSYMESKKAGNLGNSPQTKKMASKGIFSRLEEIHIQQPSASTRAGPAPNLQDSQVSSTDEVRPGAASSLSSPKSGPSSFGASVVIDKELPSMLFQTESPVKNEAPETISHDRFDESAIPFSDLNRADKASTENPKKPAGSDNNDSNDARPPGTSDKSKKDTSREEKEAMEKFSNLQSGLMLSTCGSMTVAELYMMLGYPKKLTMQYEWVNKKKAEAHVWELNKKLTNMLRRLVHLASTEFVDFKKAKPTAASLSRSPSCQCTCGAASGRKDGTPPSSKLATGRSPRVSSPAVSRLRTSSPAPGDQPGTPGKPHRFSQLTAPSTPTSSKCPPLVHSPEVQPKMAETVLVPGQTLPGDGVFKLPTSVPPRVQQIRPHLQGDKQQTVVVNNPELFLPRRTNQRRMQRNVRRSSSYVVQRTLLPKAQTPSRQIMTLTMVPGVTAANQTASFLPVTVSDSLQSLQHTVGTSTVSNAANRTLVSQGLKHPRSTPGTVTTMSLDSLNKRSTVRRIIPTPVSEAAESAVFSEPRELKISKGNILQQAAQHANINTSQITNQGVFKTGIKCHQLIPNISGVPTSGSSRPGPGGPSGEAVPSVSGLQTTITSRPGTLSLGNVALSKGFGGIAPGTAQVSHSLATTSATDTLSQGPPGTLRPEPPNISALLDISIPSVGDIGESTDKLIDMTLMNSSSSFGVLGDKDVSLSSLLNDVPVSGAISPTKGFKGIITSSADEQWLNSEEFNFLNSPVKKVMTSDPSIPSMVSMVTARTPGFPERRLPMSQQLLAATHHQLSLSGLSESSRDSTILGKLDVDATFQAMMNENSLDYMSKFADLVAIAQNQEASKVQEVAKEALPDKAI